MAWCVALCQSNCELRAESNLVQQGFEPYIPRIRQRLIVGGKKVFRERPLFGRYFFVSFIDRWRAILSTRGIAGLLLSGETPSLVSDFEIARLRDQERNGIIKLKKQSQFKRGQPVRIESGDMVGLSGIYDGMSSRDREVVLLNMMGRMVRTELAAGDMLSRY